MCLKEILKSFNRKERDWVVRNLLGSSADCLDPDFCKKLAHTVRKLDPKFEFDENPYWSIDFHVDWLVGALHHFANPGKNFVPDRNKDRIIRGSNEDFDLVIATGGHLLLIEAKGVGGWIDDQILRKASRLKSLTPWLIDKDGCIAGTRIVFLLLSPKGPRKFAIDEIPQWTLVNNELLHVKMKRPLDEFLIVSRYDDEKPNKDGLNWAIGKINYRS